MAGVLTILIAMLGIGLSTPELALPMAIFAIFIVGLFGAPALWLRAGANVGYLHYTKKRSWNPF